ncbi:hypothetical protein [Streptomyces huiliensis]|uniref:hypothetical protein n=1 Tax=Streptomyces huiliensis TaxID=2876027 RepID=UPI001CBBB22B|nr:hypothetical protein [Streptomyces huiliensis]MBZ4321983.1 hypothetical protein [Streptomyces huiliensis]
MAGMFTAAKLKVELDTLKTFKGRVDEALIKLGDSEAAPTRMASATLDPGHLGRNFKAVDALYGAYRDVHEDLTALSRLLADQIEALSVAVRGMHNDYQETDERHRARMWAVQQELLKHYDPRQDPHAPSNTGKPPADGGGNGNGSGADGEGGM